MPLTDLACKQAKRKEKPYKKADSKGLYLEVMPTGSKYWRHRYRFGGKDTRISLGVYPEISLDAARTKRDSNRKLLAEGIDPAVARKQQRLAIALNTATTFEVVARDWHTNYGKKWTPSYGKEILHRMEMDLFPSIGDLPIADIKPIHVLKALQKIESRGAHETARRAMQYCSQVFRYAVIAEKAGRDVTVDLRGALVPARTGHFAALEADELPDFLKALDRNDARLFPQTRNAMRLLLLTFVRTSELIGATWDEIHLETAQWLIPAERMKMRRPHIIPLSAQALEIFKDQHHRTGNWQWVFPNQAHPHEHMSNNTILKALERLGYKGRMTGHGFRALAMSTIKERLHYRHEVVDRQLAHAPANKLAAAYDRATFLEDRKRMMQEWADYLERLLDTSKVIQFRKAS